MIFVPIGYLILGGLGQKYGIPYLNEYFFQTVKKNTAFKEYCQKCNIMSELNYTHCDNCNTCHSEMNYRQCRLCHQCIYLNDYNRHTKKICVHEFT